MTMPINLVLIRHGESEGNVATKRSRQGDDSLYTPEFLARHSSSWRLTAKGREQARRAGAWIREHLTGVAFGRHYASEYVRAMETAALLELPGARWHVDFRLRERDWGDLDVVTDADRRAHFERNLKRRHVQPFFWTPPNGESMADVCATRVESVLDTLHRECSDTSVVMVLHGELMWGFRVRLERMSQRRYVELDLSDDPKDRIHNCQVLHYTRLDPTTGALSRHYGWMRSVCPTDPSKSRNAWEPIVRRVYSNEELLEEVELTPRLLGE